MGHAEVILVDTHVVALAGTRPRSTFNEGAGCDRRCASQWRWLGICDITLRELSALFRKGRIHLEISLESFLAEVEARFVVLPISGRACVRALRFPEAYPENPADRIIGATALVEGLSLLTADREIRQSRAVPTIW
jgi:PIN domain nuclease of toxin-antitoxin system